MFPTILRNCSQPAAPNGSTDTPYGSTDTPCKRRPALGVSPSMPIEHGHMLCDGYTPQTF